jgi:hypothetical protein
MQRVHQAKPSLVLRTAGLPVQKCDVPGKAVEVLQEAPYPGVAPRIAVLQYCRRYQRQVVCARVQQHQ